MVLCGSTATGRRQSDFDYGGNCRGIREGPQGVNSERICEQIVAVLVPRFRLDCFSFCEFSD